MTRTLSLRREALTELTDDALGQVAGGIREYSHNLVTCPLRMCLTIGATCLTCICE